MTEPKFTPGPWRKRESHGGALGNAVEAKTERRSHDADTGYRILATYQEACGSDLVADQDANRAANGALIVAAPELYGQHDVNLADLSMLRRAIVDGDPKSELLLRLDDIVTYTERAMAKARGE